MCSPSAGPGARVASPGVRLSLTGTPSSLTGRSAPGLGELHHHLARRHQLGVQRLVELQHRLQAAVVLGGERAPLLAGARGEDRRTPRDAASEPGGSKACSTRSSRPTPSAERLPELRLQRAQRDVAVGARDRAGSR